ncbi:MAG: glycosyltransferase [Pseudonocardiaceae bacterium]
MRILQIHNQYSLPGGEDAAADAEAALLKEAGHDVNPVRVRNPAGGSAAVVKLAGAAWNPMRYREMRRFLRADRPDVAHLHNSWFSLSASVIDALHAEGVPIVMTLHNYRLLCSNALLFRDGKVCTDCVGGHPWHAVRHKCYRDSMGQSAVAAATIAGTRSRGTWERVTRFLAPSQFVKNIYVSAGFDPERIIVKSNAVADPGPRASRPSTSSTVLCVGRLAPEKGVGTLLEAWRSAAGSLRNLELLIVGDGPSRESLERDAPDRVRFTGWASGQDLRRLMLASRALVVPTECYETFGLVAVEAMAAGMPVVCSNIAGPSEVAGELGAEWLVTPGDVAGWEAALNRLADDGSVDTAGDKARGLYAQKFTISEGLRMILAAYDEAMRAVGVQLTPSGQPSDLAP